MRERKGSYICILCDKVDFAIESLDQLIPMSEWKDVFKRALVLNGASTEKADAMVADHTSLMANVFCRIAAVYTVDTLKIPPQQATMMFAALAEGTAVGIHEAERQAKEDPLQAFKDRLIQRLKDLDS